MCWSGEASATVAALGIGLSAYSYCKKDPPAIWLILGYFALMEALQAFTYIYIDQCGEPANQISALLGYIHIMFQPFFINAFSMYFVPAQVRKRIEIPVYVLCFASAIFMAVQMYPFAWAGECDPRRILCATQLCAVSGNWHIAWEIPVNGIGNFMTELAQVNWLAYPFRNGFFSYALVGFALPLLYGSWRFTIYHFISGPLLSQVLSDNKNEQPAIWCLVSFAILLVAAETPLRKRMFVKNWFLWPQSIRTQARTPLPQES